MESGSVLVDSNVYIGLLRRGLIPSPCSARGRDRPMWLRAGWCAWKSSADFVSNGSGGTCAPSSMC